MWMELLNAPSLAQLVIAPGRKDHSIVSFMALRIIRGDMCWETSQNVRFEEMGLGVVPNEISGVLDLAPWNIVAVGTNRPFAKRDFCICIGRTWGQPIMCVRSLSNHATKFAGRCTESQTNLEVEPAGK